MNMPKMAAAFVAFFLATALTGCSNKTQSPAVADNVSKSLDQAGFNDVSVSQDRDKGVITLNGHVPTDSDKEQAESIAKSQAGGQVVANQIAVLPPGDRDAKAINSDLDKGIRSNLDAVLIQANFDKDVDYDVKNGVVTLKGQVNSQARRDDVARVAATVPYVTQVVNEVQVRNQKATSTP